MTAEDAPIPLDAGVVGRHEDVADELGEPPPSTPRTRFFDVPVDDIAIPAGWRLVNEEAVQRLMDSVRDIGPQAQFAVSVRWAPAGAQQRCILVAGRHRLEAARRLGWELVPATIFEGTDAEARMWRAAENVAGAELSTLERAEQIKLWEEARAENLGTGAQVSIDGGRGKTGGLSEAAREPRLDRRSLRRYRDIAGMSDEAKLLVAANRRILDNSRALELAARQGGADAQVSCLRKLLSNHETVRRSAEWESARCPEAWIPPIETGDSGVVVTFPRITPPEKRPVDERFVRITPPEKRPVDERFVRIIPPEKRPEEAEGQGRHIMYVHVSPPGVEIQRGEQQQQTQLNAGRAEVIMRMAALLDLDPGRTLEDLIRLIRDQRDQMEKIPREKRVAHARGVLTALGLTLEDLQTTIH